MEKGATPTVPQGKSPDCFVSFEQTCRAGSGRAPIDWPRTGIFSPCFSPCSCGPAAAGEEVVL